MRLRLIVAAESSWQLLEEAGRADRLFLELQLRDEELFRNDFAEISNIKLARFPKAFINQEYEFDAASAQP